MSETNASNMYENFTLLIDGKEAFPEIINCINNATKSIKINMFIWRDDEIGNKIGEAILNAANKGVKVDISIDRYGVILEKCEESKKSLFHKEQNMIEKIKIKTLESIYQKDNKNKIKDTCSDLYKNIISHPNIIVNKDTFKADHSKYYIIDDKTLILGGINIEDKENGSDLQGRKYQDYMIKIQGESYINNFKHKLNNKINLNKDYFFGINIKDHNDKYFEMEQLYLDMIKKSKTNLLITMAYFSSIKDFIDEIIEANNRGVNINIMIPKNANFQDDTNKATIKKIMKLTNNKVNVYLSDKMVHTKMIINDDFISIGSTNITKKAFNQLDELNLFIKNIDCPFKEKLVNSILENINSSVKVNSYKEIKYNKLLSSIERFLV